MRPFALARAVARFALLGLLPSCSLLGLERVEVASCDRCDALNERDGLTGCDVWQCGPDAYCVRGRPDRDRDGDVSLACGGTDCDDLDGAVSGAATERCDGRDNDCNGVIDDATDQPAERAVVVLADVGSPEAVTIAPALDDGVLIAWRTAGVTSLARVTDLSPTAELDLVTTTNADRAGSPVLDAETTEGCPIPSVLSLAPTPCGAGDVCPGSLSCVTGPEGERICESAVVPRDVPLPSDCATHAECQDDVTCNGLERCDPRSPLSDPLTGCRSAPPPCAAPAVCDEALAACTDASVGSCRIDDVAFAASAASTWMAVTIDALDCATGALRVGALSTASTPVSLRYWGDARVSTAWPAVALDADGCSGAEDLLGASRAAIAVLPAQPASGRDLPEALAAFRAEPYCEAGACAASAPVAILGLWHERSAATDDVITWTNASDDGLPVVLPTASTGERLALSTYAVGSGASRRAGYVLGYAASGGVALALVPALGAPHPSCLESGPPCLDRQPGPDGVLGTADDPAAESRLDPALPPRTSSALAAPRAELLDEPTAITDVALAVGAGEGVPLLVVWATATELVLAPLEDDPVAGLLTEGARTRMPMAGVRELHVGYVPEGIGAGEGAANGGWVVTWASDEGTFALRLDADAGMIGSGVVQLDALPSASPQAYLDREGTTARVRVVAHRGDAFVAYPSVCGPTP